MNITAIRDYIKSRGRAGIAGAISVTIFFVVIVLAFYSYMYSSIEENIVLQGEKIAIESTERFDRFVVTSANLLKLEKHMLDQMLEDGESTEKIKDYLEEETIRIQDAINPGYSGLYGYIMDEYLDGAGWVPDDDYVPTQRPWYIAATDNKGEIAIVKPYLDAQTNTIITTLAITLNDGESVVALDIGFDMIKTVASASLSSDEPIQIILDNDGNVVAHSFVDEIGHNYRSESGTMGALILEHLGGADSSHFIIDYKATRYMVYVMPISNGWYSLSVQDITSKYRNLNLTVIIVFVEIILMVLILTVLFARSFCREIRARRLNQQLATSSDIYMSMFDVDLINDRSEAIKSTINIEDLAGGTGADLGAQEVFSRIMDAIPDSPTKTSAKKFVDLSTLGERLSQTNTVSIEFLSFGNLWCRARFIVSERLEDGRLSHVLWMVENIDAEKRSRDQLIDMSDRAIAASEAKSSFLSNMSHEIRTPINAMLGLNEMVLRECDDPDILSYSTGINTAGHTLLGIVNDILDFSKIEAGKMEIIPVDYSLASMLNDLINMVHTRADAKGLSIDVKVDSHIPDGLFGDEIRIKQIITNLLTNSVKYTEKGGITISLSYEKKDEESIILTFSVKDTGIGIKEEDMSRLFSEFDRIEEKRNRNIEGTGLGMAITQRLLSMLGTALKVESVYGEGSTFSFDLLQKVTDWKEIGDYENTYRMNIGEKAEYREKFTAPEADVLVVDDTPLNLTVFISLLKKTKVRIDAVESGDAAIEAACAKKYDVIFLDHMMPDKDGIETLKELSGLDKNLNRNTPVICLTANAISGMKEKYIEAGFDDYLSKPIDSLRLEEMLMQYIPPEKIIAASPEEIDDGGADEGDMSDLPKGLFAIRELKVKEAVKKCGSAAVYMEILAAYCKGISRFVQDAGEYMMKGDLKGASIKIHAIKSQVRTVGAYDLGELAQKLETAAKEDDTGVLDQYGDELLGRSMTLSVDIGSALKDAGTDIVKLPPMSDERLDEIFTELVRCATEYDLYNIDDIAEELRTHEIPAGRKDKVEEVLAVIDGMDYERIPDTVQRQATP